MKGKAELKHSGTCVRSATDFTPTLTLHCPDAAAGLISIFAVTILKLPNQTLVRLIIFQNGQLLRKMRRNKTSKEYCKLYRTIDSMRGL
jgi:hypothetical protein